MKTVYKFRVPIADVFIQELPEGAIVLAVGEQLGVPQMWVELDTERPPVARRFRLFGTGHEFVSDLSLNFVGTFQTMGGRFVWHLYEETVSI